MLRAGLHACAAARRGLLPAQVGGGSVGGHAFVQTRRAGGDAGQAGTMSDLAVVGRPGATPAEELQRAALAFMPKEETQAASFVAATPEADGRGVVIAILDTGVDPGADGLQRTSEGKPKVIDVVDCTGDGDVDTTTERTAATDVDGFHTVEAFGGRTLKLPKELTGRWANPSGKYYVGAKDAYALFPGELAKRVTQKRREAFDKDTRALMTAAQKALTAFDTKHGCTQPVSGDADPAAALAPALKLERKELAARVAQLGALIKNYKDLGPRYECVLWHDGSTWRAVVDTDESGDLTTAAPLAGYREEREWRTFSDVDKLNYCVQIYDEGRRLSLVADCHSHGTHVATIAAGHFPDQPELSGVAPGAQVVSLKIGDNRLDAMETTHAVCRAIQYMMTHKVDLINMSFGEAVGRANAGRFIKLSEELVYKHGTIFLSSAGNSGPALTTVGAPGATSSCIMGVGAYVTPGMMADMYSMRSTIAANQYTWSSRGPSADGHRGVSITAPGGAIASVPNWCLTRNLLMNGTSMSSPNAAGNVALLLSALKAQGVKYSPHTIRRALENTAKPVPFVETLAMGAGVVQVRDAFNYCVAHDGAVDPDVRFDISVPSRGRARGLYLREPEETRVAFEGVVFVQPVFHEDAHNDRRIAFNMNLDLACAASWVEAPKKLLLYHSGRGVNIRVDCASLPPGSHFTEITAVDAARPEAGPVFTIPITVIRTAPLEKRYTISLRSGQIERQFLKVPEGATWCDVALHAHGDEPARNIVVHALQLHPQLPFSAYNSEKYHAIGGANGDQSLQSFKVIAGGTLELTIAQFWSSLGASSIEATVSFSGIVPDTGVSVSSGAAMATNVVLNGATGYARLDLVSALKREPSVEVSCALTGHLRAYHAKSAVVKSLCGRDLFPDARQTHELVMEYDIAIPEAGDVYIRAPLLNDLIYDAAMQSQMLVVCDAHKKVVGWSDAYPQKLSVGKGKHVVRLQVCHDDLAVLSGLKTSLIVTVERVLSGDSAVAVKAYTSRADLYGEAGKELKQTALDKGQHLPVFLKAPVLKDALAKHVKAGDVLTGKVTFVKAATAGQVRAVDRPGGFKMVFIPAPPGPEPPKAKDGEDEGDAEKKEGGEAEEIARAEDALAEQVREVKIKHLRKLCDDKKYTAYEAFWTGLAADLPAEKAREEAKAVPDNNAAQLAYLNARLATLDGLPTRTDRLDDVIAAADAVVSVVDQGELAAHYGMLVDADDTAAAKLRKKMDKQKAALVDALAKKALACDSKLTAHKEAQKDEAAGDRLTKDFNDAYAALRKWVDPSSGTDHLHLYVQHSKLQGRLAVALQCIAKQIADADVDLAADKLKKLYNARAALVEALGWEVFVAADKRALAARFPSSYPCF